MKRSISIRTFTAFNIWKGEYRYSYLLTFQENLDQNFYQICNRTTADFGSEHFWTFHPKEKFVLQHLLTL